MRGPEPSGHHDGSPLYSPEPPSALGDEFPVLLRVPHDAGNVGEVVVRTVTDGEPEYAVARLDRRDAGADWYRADLVAHNPTINYRFLLGAGPSRYRWLNAVGEYDHDIPDSGDFRVRVGVPQPPSWLADAVVYQVFPDRFARSVRVDLPPPDWAIPTPWDSPPVRGGPSGPLQFYAGDLYGVAEHLDHIAAIGANTLYLTPVFPAPSNHRYNAATFDTVDPLLGGDAAFGELVAACHARGMRVIGDLTTNHTGSLHPWLAAAVDPANEQADYYYFEGSQRTPVGWLGHSTLPKLDYRSAALRERMVTAPDSVVRHWLQAGLDGWRIDVANMTGRYRDTDLTVEIARAIRAVMAQENPDAYLVGEHFHDFLADLDGSTWQGTMNYAGFAKPLWTWLCRADLPAAEWLGVPIPRWPRLPGTATMATMRSFSATPWPVRSASMNVVSSHDTPRIRSITGDPDLVAVALAAMFAHPGVPMIWAGDEIGLTGETGTGGRMPFPWQAPQSWDERTLRAVGELTALRRDSPALRTGSMRWLHADADRLIWVREVPGETILVLLARASGPPIRLPWTTICPDRGVGAHSVFGGASLHSAGESAIVTGDGPTAQMWRLSTT